jgi:acyl-homoserine-lactone acylase
MPPSPLHTALLLLSTTIFTMQAHTGQPEILWDKYGVPHIYGEKVQDMYHAYGWAQMHNHANLMLRLYAQARGCAAAYLGEDYLTSDSRILLFNLPDQAVRIYQQQDREYKMYLDAFVSGMNHYADVHTDEIDETARPVLPVTAYDVIAHTLRVIHLEFLAGEDIRIAETMAGSNACALAPPKTASGNTMLLMNPHLPWSDFFTWFEAHLTAEGFHAYGVSLVGMPFLAMAFNDHLGWAHTVNPIDASDRYALKLLDGGYELDGKVIPFETKTVAIKARQHDGSFTEMEKALKYSKHGPVIWQNDTMAYAIRIAGLGNAGIFEQYHKMAKAGSFDEFESALKMLQNPMFNVIYADKAGHIFYLFNGNIPKRRKGDFAFWKATIDGTESAYIWDQTHPYKDLPRVLDPASGFLQNCNDPPWSCTDPPAMDRRNFPAYFSSRATQLRPQRAVNMIRNNPAVSFGQLINYKHDTKMEAAERFLDDLLKAVERHPDPAALEAAAVLQSWDKQTEADSRGAVLFAGWWDRVRSEMLQTPWSMEDPFRTPDGIREPERAVGMLISAAHEVRDKHGRLDVAWGDIHRYRMNGLDFPANGGPGHYGIFRTVYFTEDTDHKMKAIAGETFTAVIEFGETVKAMVILPYGNATQPGSPHAGDQLEMLSEKKLRPALLDRTTILQNTAEREMLRMGDP